MILVKGASLMEDSEDNQTLQPNRSADKGYESPMIKAIKRHLNQYPLSKEESSNEQREND